MEIRAKELWALKEQGLNVVQFVGGGVLIVQANFVSADDSFCLSVGDVLVPYWVRAPLAGIGESEDDDMILIGQFGRFVLLYSRQQPNIDDFRHWHFRPPNYSRDPIFKSVFTGIVDGIWALLERAY